ncbi:caspase family protein [Alsobacter metallidurans]|nr:caspase domain-containing protein [Alsobacter metallidurans]
MLAVALASGVGAPPAAAQQTEKRIALVLGNAAYPAGALSFPANDAGLMAQTLQASGFDVVGARDLDGDGLRKALRDFVDKASQSGPETVAAVYFSGYGLQFEGENYLVPVDAQIARAGDVPIQAIRVADLLRPLASVPLKARIVVLDAARENPFARSGPPLAGGLALMDADPGMLVAFNAAPGSVAPPLQDAYGPYARALAEMIREGGLPLADVFDRARLRTSELTQGAVVPWDADRVTAPFLFLERTADAPVPKSAADLSRLRDGPIRDLDARDAYQAALGRDTIQAYQDFLAAYPQDPMARRIRPLLAARREALIWRRTSQVGTTRAYWSYLRRYPRGPHAGEAERRLGRLAAALQPPPGFEVLDYDVPPPPPDEFVYFERPVLMFADPVYDLPPPPPLAYLEPIPAYFVDLPPPPPPVEYYVLPQPIYEPVPVYVERPAYVAPPPLNLITYNIHNTVIVNPQANTIVVRSQAGEPLLPWAGAEAVGIVPRTAQAAPATSGAGQGQPKVPMPGAPAASGAATGIGPGAAAVAGAAVAAGAAAAAMRVALPPSVAAKAPRPEAPTPAALVPQGGAGPQPAAQVSGGVRPGTPGGLPGTPSLGAPLRGAPMSGQPLVPRQPVTPGQSPVPGQAATPSQGQHALPSALPPLPGRPGGSPDALASPGRLGSAGLRGQRARPGPANMAPAAPSLGAASNGAALQPLAGASQPAPAVLRGRQAVSTGLGGRFAPPVGRPSQADIAPSRRRPATATAPQERVAAPPSQQRGPAGSLAPVLRAPAPPRAEPPPLRQLPPFARSERPAPAQMRAPPPQIVAPRPAAPPPPQVRAPAPPQMRGPAPPLQMRAPGPPPQLRTPSPPPQVRSPAPRQTESRGPASRPPCGGPGQPSCH